MICSQEQYQQQRNSSKFRELGRQTETISQNNKMRLNSNSKKLSGLEDWENI